MQLFVPVSQRVSSRRTEEPQPDQRDEVRDTRGATPNRGVHPHLPTPSTSRRETCGMWSESAMPAHCPNASATAERSGAHSAVTVDRTSSARIGEPALALLHHMRRHMSEGLRALTASRSEQRRPHQSHARAVSRAPVTGRPRAPSAAPSGLRLPAPTCRAAHMPSTAFPPGAADIWREPRRLDQPLIEPLVFGRITARLLIHLATGDQRSGYHTKRVSRHPGCGTVLEDPLDPCLCASPPGRRPRGGPSLLEGVYWGG